MKEFDRIIGYASIKKELEQISDTLKNKEAYAKLGASSPKGLFLHGEPGVGKTLMANCLIEASGRPVFICRKDEPNGMFVQTIKNTFTKAAQNAPSIVFLDDIDKFTNGDERHRDAEEYVTVQSCIDELKGAEVFVLATANKANNLPRSLLRPGRFDRVIEVDAPKGSDAEKIIDHYLKSKRFVDGIDVKNIARIMDGRSCAELETVINEAGLYAGYERNDCITMEHFMKACLHTVFNVTGDIDDDYDFDEYESSVDNSGTLSQIICHEAGHVVVSEVIMSESVTLVSVYKGDENTNGFTSYYDSNISDPQKRAQINILGSLAGMAAVEQRLGINDLGSSTDLQKAFSIVHRQITDNCVSGFGLYDSNYSTSSGLRERQEQAIAVEIERYYKKAKEIVALNGGFFDKVVAELEEKGLLTTQDIQRIKAGCVITPVSI